jgi:hypothetical protein
MKQTRDLRGAVIFERVGSIEKTAVTSRRELRAAQSVGVLHNIISHFWLPDFSRSMHSFLPPRKRSRKMTSHFWLTSVVHACECPQ